MYFKVVITLIAMCAYASAAPKYVSLGNLAFQSNVKVTTYTTNIPDTLIALNNTGTPRAHSLDTLLALAITRPGIIAALSAPSVTLWAPTDVAFNSFVHMNPGLNLSGDAVTETLAFHAVPNFVYKPDPDVPLTIVPTAQTPLQSIITYDGTAVNVQYAGLFQGKVIESLVCSNGIIHVVKKVLALPTTVSATAAQVPTLSELVDALDATNLTSTIDNLNAVTVFAPINSAFDAISDVTATLNTSQLASVLEYHVIPATAFSTQLKDGEQFTTVLGQTLTVSLADGKVTIIGAGSNATVVMANVQTSNGVVHVIDTVLIPKL
ncbi:hypothetical protein SmJEL517_g02270 [Synchytrium microbalum]|uniref:FAS1 domain-containing protein n=1 Tax=Synchytrium microbalum TaxID=1806994 RepID=A0A507C6L4_9FUNG|nr:uncharacterized protein SmJEL517_g02270 [Synchytrium microbalum]TPX35262.1 hypothetical protein SmJEL517_g02270 [Synchytrium microbalum]